MHTRRVPGLFALACLLSSGRLERRACRWRRRSSKVRGSGADSVDSDHRCVGLFRLQSDCLLIRRRKLCYSCWTAAPKHHSREKSMLFSTYRCPRHLLSDILEWRDFARRELIQFLSPHFLSPFPRLTHRNIANLPCSHQEVESRKSTPGLLGIERKTNAKSPDASLTFIFRKEAPPTSPRSSNGSSISAPLYGGNVNPSVQATASLFSSQAYVSTVTYGLGGIGLCRGGGESGVTNRDFRAQENFAMTPLLNERLAK